MATFSKANDVAAKRSALVYGGGCIGAVTCYLLSRAICSSNIAVVCRSNFEHVRDKGFTIHSTIWGDALTVRPQAFTTPEQASLLHRPEYGYVFVTTKSQSKDATNTDAIAAVVSANTTIVLMQNGIAIETAWHQRFPQNPVLSVVLYLPVAQIEPSVFTHKLHTELQMGTYPTQTIPGDTHAANMCTELCAIFKQGGAAATIEQDIQVARWKKVLINGSENPICALTQLPDATFFRSSDRAIRCTKEVMGEIAAIACATGCLQIDQTVVQKQLEFLTARPLPGVVPSMMADVKATRPMEIDGILGNLLELAQETLTPTPRLEPIYSLVKGLDQSC
jgi:2-dehydropantoate 2-reductase